MCMHIHRIQTYEIEADIHWHFAILHPYLIWPWYSQQDWIY